MSQRRGGTAERWNAVEEALDRALELPAGDRATVLADLEPAVAAEVEELLGEVDQPGPLDHDLPTRWLESTPPGLSEPAVRGQRFGPWEVVRRLGAGGMGVVYLARRADGEYEQQAALKVLRRDLHLPDQAERLATERQILARLDHPAIARLLDGGVGPGGAPYLVMEWVDGRPLDEYARAHDLSVEARLGLFRTICGAVETAHRSLVLHRDLKPSNVLVRRDRQAKLLDFGIAKLLRDDAALVNQTRGTPGTPSYAAPEQIRGEPVSLAVDVWGLGVLLYQLLAGVHPFAGEGDSAFAVQSRILESDAELPSRAVLRHRDDLGERDRRRLAERLRGDLDAIVLRALAARPEDRYGTVGELIADLERHRDALPVVARRWTVAYRGRRFLRRHRWSLAVAAVVVALLAALAVLTARHLGVTSRQAEEIDRERRHAEAATNFLVDVFDVSSGGQPVKVERDAARTLLDRGVEQMRSDLSIPPTLRATLLGTAGRTYYSLGFPVEARPLLREAVELHAGPGGSVRDLAFSLGLLATVAGSDLRWDDAARHLERALAAVRASEDPALEERHLPGLLSQLASVERSRGNLERGEDLARRATELARQAGDREVHEEAEAVLASFLARRGLHEEAEARYRAVLQRQIDRLGERHEGMARTLNDLAFLLRHQERYDEAETLYRRSFSILEEHYPQGHQDQMMVLANLASVQSLRGDAERVRSTLRQRVEMARNLYPENWRRTDALLGLVRLEIQEGRYAAALRSLVEAEAVPLDTSAIRPADTRRTIRLLHGACLLAVGEEVAGRRLLDQVAPRLPAQETLGFYGLLRTDAANLLQEAGYPQDAEAIREEPATDGGPGRADCCPRAPPVRGFSP